MAEDLRAILSQLDPRNTEQHGDEAPAVAQHDFHLERGLVSVTLVGKVRSCCV